MSKSYDDPVKAEARSKLRSFIERNSLKRFEDLRVLCFPGAEVEGQEALEVKQIYDALGIPRGNITGLEIDPRRARRLKRAGLGINIVNSDAYSFFESTDQVFDVISLDYTGPQTLRETNTLGLIAGRHVLNSRGILCTNYLGKRENTYLQHLIKLRNQARGQVVKVKIPGTSSTSILDLTTQLVDKMNQTLRDEAFQADLDKSREDGISQEIRNIFAGGTLDLPRPLHLWKDDGLLDAMIETTKKGILMGDFEDKINEMVERYKLPRDKIIELMLEEREFSKGLYLRGFNYEVNTLACMRSEGLEDITRDQAVALTWVKQDKLARGYFINHQERYSYVSNSGSPMLMDLFSFKPLPEGLFSALSRITCLPENQESSKNMGLFNPLHLPFKRFSKEIVRLTDHFYKATERNSSDPPKRIFLGSSAKPVLTRERAIEEFQAGATIDEIRAKYRGVKGKPLAQWKAHVTMGTYGPKEIRETIREDAEDSDLEKITKEDAVDLISAGIPLSEIISAYPTSFTKGQLAAFKAHLTMGTYQETEKQS